MNYLEFRKALNNNIWIKREDLNIKIHLFSFFLSRSLICLGAFICVHEIVEQKIWENNNHQVRTHKSFYLFIVE